MIRQQALKNGVEFKIVDVLNKEEVITKTLSDIEFELSLERIQGCVLKASEENDSGVLFIDIALNGHNRTVHCEFNKV